MRVHVCTYGMLALQKTGMMQPDALIEELGGDKFLKEVLISGLVLAMCMYHPTMMGRSLACLSACFCLLMDRAHQG